MGSSFPIGPLKSSLCSSKNSFSQTLGKGLAVPLDCPGQSLFECDSRLPSEDLFGLRGIEPLAVDLAVTRPRSPDVRADPLLPRKGDNLLHEIEHLHRPVVSPVKDTSRHAVAGEASADLDVKVHHVVDVDEIPLRRPVASNDGIASLQDSNRTDARVVQVAAAVNVGETRHGHGEAEGVEEDRAMRSAQALDVS